MFEKLQNEMNARRLRKIGHDCRDSAEINVG